jgi:hypothetical protein
VEKQATEFSRILPSFEATDLGVHLEMWIAQASFIVADLRDNLEAATGALQLARGIVGRIGADRSATLAEVRDALADIEEMFGVLQGKSKTNR